MAKKPTKSAKTLDRLAIHASFDDVIGVTVKLLSNNTTNKISSPKSPSTSNSTPKKKK